MSLIEKFTELVSNRRFDEALLMARELESKGYLEVASLIWNRWTCPHCPLNHYSKEGEKSD